MKRARVSDRALYLIFRVAAFLAAALPPAIRALMLFPVWQEGRELRLRAGLGGGALLALVIILAVFRSTIIATVKKHMGMVRVLATGAVYLLLVGLRLAAPYIPKLEEIAFYALIGGLLSWGLSAVAMIFRLRGGEHHGADES